MVFEPAKGLLACRYCGNTQALLKANAQQRAAMLFEHPLTSLSVAQGEVSQAPFETVLSRTAQEVDCPGCRVTLTFEPPDVADQCPFCQTSIVIQPRAASPMIAPSGVVPFKLGRRDAMQTVQAWLRQRWDFNDLEAIMIKGKLKSRAQLKQPIGVYLPFWTYDAQTVSDYKGAYKQSSKTSWSSVSGQLSHGFDDVMVVASKACNRDRLDELWSSVSMNDVVPYDPPYLAGFKAQRYQIPVAEGFDRAMQHMKSKIRDLIRKEIGGFKTRIDRLETNYSQISFKHVLLPVWLLSYRYEGKAFQVTVNAQTGKVLGERPISLWRYCLAVLLATILCSQSQNHQGQ